MKRILKHWKWMAAASLLALALWFYFCLPETLFEVPTSSVLVDADGRLLAARIAEDGQWRFAEGDSLPSRFVKALVAFEDRSFFDHSGVSIQALGRAFVQNIKAGRVVSGGSTLSMQVVRLSRRNPARDYFEKATEVFRAWRLETRYTKEEVLSFYCTHAPMGGNVVGVEAAAWRYFNRSPHQLSWAEAATLAVLPNAPALIFPGKNQERLLEKRNRLLRYLHEQGEFDALSLELSLEEPLPQGPKRLPQRALHLLNTLESEQGRGQRFHSTLETEVQIRAEEVVNEHHKRLRSNLVHNAAALIVDARSGEVKAYIGNTASGEHGSHVDVVHAPRSPGSSLKPFLYAASLDAGVLTPRSLLPDVPVNLGGFSPKNFSEQYYGAMPADEALARSLNIPFVVQLRSYGLLPFHQKLRDLGFRQLSKPSRHYGLSMILGGGECTLYELTEAWYGMSATLHDFQALSGRYRKDRPHIQVLVNEGRRDEMEAQKQPHGFSAGATYLTMKALEQVRRPDDAQGWEHMEGASSIAWKTGTSYGFRDAWAIGASADYIVAVWVGNADGTGRPGVIGTQAAAPLMFSLFGILPNEGGGRRLPQPYDDLSEVEVCKLSGMKRGMNCPDTQLEAWPISCTETPLCIHHQAVYLDESGRFRSNAGCDPGGRLEQRFVLPPLQAYYYKKYHPEYRPLPEMSPDCYDSEAAAIPVLVHPAAGSKITLTRNLEGELQPFVAEAASAGGPDDVIYWHLGETYLGSTRSIHRMSFVPERSGAQVLKLVNASGRSLLVRFEVSIPRGS